jgi:chromosomal replication initiator protein
MENVAVHGSAQKAWLDCLTFISPKVKKQTFHTWFQPVRPIAFERSTLVLEVANQFAADWIQEHFRDLLAQALRDQIGSEATYTLKVRESRAGGKAMAKQKPPSPQLSLDVDSTSNGAPSTAAGTNGSGNGHAAEPEGGSRAVETPQAQASTYAPPVKVSHRPAVGLALSDRYTFDTFVVGESNQFAHAAALSVAESGGTSKFNPLYIYGRVGLGKTHLAQAIGHLVLELNPRARVVYATSEKFTNDFISSLSAGNTAEFTQRYRSVDLLIVDDIQFFAGKESTQAQFFHTFNDLFQNGRRIVLTSDRPPKEISGLEERLLSRFGSGLVTDIQPPDLETRIAILKKKNENEQIDVPEECLHYIADHITSNIRELQGSLIRLLAYASLCGKDVTLDLTREVLQDTLEAKRPPLTIEMIQKAVAAHFNLPIESMWTKKKTQEIVNARQIAMYLARELTGSPLKTIGSKFGGRDHSTVIHACTQVAARMREDQTFKQHIDQMINNLYS